MNCQEFMDTETCTSIQKSEGEIQEFNSKDDTRTLIWKTIMENHLKIKNWRKWR